MAPWGHRVTEQVHSSPHLWNHCVHLALLPIAVRSRRPNSLIILLLYSRERVGAALGHA